MITAGSEISGWLLAMDFECVILHAAYRVRRRNPSLAKVFDAAEPNKLLGFVQQISTKTKNMLLATAAPVQIDPSEAWDLLDVLCRGSDTVLGSYGSSWRKPRPALDLQLGHAPPPKDGLNLWGWLRNPLPPSSMGRIGTRVFREDGRAMAGNSGRRVPQRTSTDSGNIAPFGRRERWVAVQRVSVSVGLSNHEPDRFVLVPKWLSRHETGARCRCR